MTIRRVVPNIASDKLDACRDFYGLFGFQVAMDMGWIMTLSPRATRPPNSASCARMRRRPSSRRSPSRLSTSTPSMPGPCGAVLSWCIR